MNFKFEELPITVNGQKFLVDGALDIEPEYWNEEADYFNDEEIQLYAVELTRITDNEGYNIIPIESVKSEVFNEIYKAFYSADSKLYDDALTFWSER